MTATHPHHANKPKRPPFPRLGTDLAQLEWRLAFDLMWVCATLLKITAKEGNRLVNFVFNDVQLWVYWNILDQELAGEGVRLWILKGRQFGISTFFCARQFVKSAFHGANCLLLAHREGPGKTMFGKVERMLRNLPPVQIGSDVAELVPKPSSHITTDYVLWNTPALNALIKRESAENEDAGVSETYQHVHLTEGPLWRNMAHTMGGLLPTIPDDPDTTIVGEFTARGEGDYTHDVWQQCEAGTSPLRGIFLPYYWHKDYQRPKDIADKPWTTEEKRYRDWVAKVGHAYPLKRGTLRLLPEFQAIRDGRKLVPGDLALGFKLSDEQMLWRRDRLAEFRGDHDLFRREYPATPAEAFQSSGRRLIPGSIMDRLDLATDPTVDRGEYEAHRGSGGKAKVKYRKREDGRVWRWEAPAADCTYVIDADPSSGVGMDFAGAHVLKVTFQMVDVVASFQGMERPHDFARLLARMGRHYRCDATLSNTTGKLEGGTPALIVVERNGFGEHVIYELDQTMKYRRLYRHDQRGKRDDWRYDHRYGFPVTKATKMPMLQHLVQLCYDDHIRVRCPRTRNEMRGLTYLDDLDQTAGATQGAHDDLAMAIGEGALVAAQRGAFRRQQRFGSSVAAPRAILFGRTGR